MKLLRIDNVIPKDYTEALIDYIENNRPFIKDYKDKKDIVVNNPYTVEFELLAGRDSSASYDYTISTNFNINTSKGSTFLLYREINNIEDLKYGYYMIEGVFNSNEYDIDKIVTKVELDILKDTQYYQDKRIYIEENIDTKENLLEGLLYINSLSDKFERLELVYALLMNQIKTGKIVSNLKEEYLIDKLASFGYDEPIKKPSKVGSDIEALFNYLMYLLLNNLIGVGRKPTINQYVITKVYDKYIDLMFK